MGFYKSVSLLPKEEQKKYLPNFDSEVSVTPHLPLNDWENCRRCGSANLSYSKHINWGPNAGTSYHYKVKCLDCRRSYHVERNSHVYKKVKDIPWTKSKSVLKMEAVQGIDHFQWKDKHAS